MVIAVAHWARMLTRCAVVMGMMGSSGLALGEGHVMKPCVALTPAHLSPKHDGGESVTLVFFSSWCSTCVKSLEKPRSGAVYYVGAFDKPERAAKVLKKFHPTATCYFSDGLAEALGVKVVPAERTVVIAEN